MRLTLALQSKLCAEAAEAGKAVAEQRDEVRAAENRAAWNREQARHDRLERILRRVIATEHDDEETIERLTDEAWERLYDQDVCGALLQQPFAEIVEFICRDMGLSPDWARLSHEAWVREGDCEPPRTASRPAPPEAEQFAFSADLNSSAVGGGDLAAHAGGP